ncbi:uncharacterized protein AKAME5_000576400 [Lates japonicus]|uniref:Uncharacterized protein n=1 Tax=Lates japonicus TaxID=270547 RepID=A0AAD3R2Q7_LATJO|nr:uncharacterized protein AKAME5_000576400 [Lates japonicus]
MTQLAPVHPEKEGLCTRHLESLARDIERVIESLTLTTIFGRSTIAFLIYLMLQKLKLIWKTTARRVHLFLETLLPGAQDRYLSLCLALREEHCLYTDQSFVTLGAFTITQNQHETSKRILQAPESCILSGAQCTRSREGSRK